MRAPFCTTQFIPSAAAVRIIPPKLPASRTDSSMTLPPGGTVFSFTLSRYSATQNIPCGARSAERREYTLSLTSVTFPAQFARISPYFPSASRVTNSSQGVLPLFKYSSNRCTPSKQNRRFCSRSRRSARKAACLIRSFARETISSIFHSPRPRAGRGLKKALL